MSADPDPEPEKPAPKLPDEEEPEPPLPFRALLAACLCNFAHFYSVCSLFSYAGIMSVDLGWASDVDSAGFVAGYLSSANTLGRMPCAVLWGWLARRMGMRRAMAASMFFIAAGTALFGLCTKLELAVAVRFLLLGAANGWVALFPSLAVELGGTQRQTEVIGLVFASGTVVQLLGPAFGGWSYGWVKDFPAAVPNLVGSALALAAMLGSLRWLPESKGAKGGAQEKGEGRSLGEVMCSRPMPFLTLLRALQGGVCFAFFEVVPLWAISTRELGGLGLSEDSLGLVLSCSALGTGAYMATLMPRLAKLFGLRRAALISAVASAAALALLPYSPGSLTLILLHCLANCAVGQLGAAAVAFINNCAPAEQRSVVTGIAVTFEAMGKGAGPLVSAVAFAGTLAEWGRPGHSFVFEGLAAMLLAMSAGIAGLPDSVEGGKAGARKLPTTEESSPKTAA